MSEWQPIETAPTDGTEILLWYSGDERGWEKPGHRIGKMTCMCGRWFPLVGCVVYGHEWNNFTAWQPLPEPPK